MTIPTAPDAVTALAEARSRARRERDWETADRLKAEIEAAGWKVVDAASLYSLVPAAPSDVVEGDVVRHGSSASVPSRLDEPATGRATVVIEARGDPSALAATLAALRQAPSPGISVVVVANPPTADLERVLAAAAGGGPAPEVVRTSVPFGRAAARNAGIRRSSGPVVVLLDAGIVPPPGMVTDLVAALDDPGVAVSGALGLLTEDLVRFAAAPGGRHSVDAVSGSGMAFRRGDFLERGPLDERFEDDPYLDPWWCLVLRDPGEDALEGAEPREARVAWTDAVTGMTDGGLEAAGLSKPTRGRYRFLRWFATRADLLSDPD